jgi:hypothetical protein
LLLNARREKSFAANHVLQRAPKNFGVALRASQKVRRVERLDGEGRDAENVSHPGRGLGAAGQKFRRRRLIGRVGEDVVNSVVEIQRGESGVGAAVQKEEEGRRDAVDCVERHLFKRERGTAAANRADLFVEGNRSDLWHRNKDDAAKIVRRCHLDDIEEDRVASGVVVIVIVIVDVWFCESGRRKSVLVLAADFCRHVLLQKSGDGVCDFIAVQADDVAEIQVVDRLRRGAGDENHHARKNAQRAEQKEAVVLPGDFEVVEDLGTELLALDPERVAVGVEPARDFLVLFADGASEEPGGVSTVDANGVDAAHHEDVADDGPAQKEDGRAEHVAVDDVGQLRARDVLAVLVALLNGGELRVKDLALAAPAKIFGEGVTPNVKQRTDNHDKKN